MPLYTTWGPRRGSCGHEHRSLDAAVECADLDHAECEASPEPGAYTDRAVWRLQEGKRVPIDPTEASRIYMLRRRGWDG